ncbi:MAG TPA: 30S ribosomal protein S3 [Candidatus Omnitrophica bacterium]|nr:30S ribosomal protein S3 [Candidatus Omnitrophota bacterium]
MGQKIHPIAFRLGFIKNWNSRWFASKQDFAKFIEEDARIRKYITVKFRQAAISKIIIERVSTGTVRIRIYTARPGVIIGRHGADIDRLKVYLGKLIKREFLIDIVEVKSPSMDAQIVAQNIAFQLEKRVAYRRAVKRAIEQAMTAGAKGIKIQCGGRLGGVEISRSEKYKEGKIPLQTFRANIDYGFAEALTTYGLIGIKTWIYKGDVLDGKFVDDSDESQRRTKR